MSAATAPRRRTHPITPLVTGWKIVVGIVAVVSAQNIARLVNDFSVSKALIAVGVILAAIVIAIALSGLSWWFTTYAVDADGVSLHSGVISKSRQYAPRARIESVSVERPLLARFLGVAKVRVEVAGGGESYLDIEYVKSADAEQLRRRILGVATRTDAPSGGSAGAAPGDGAGTGNGVAARGDADSGRLRTDDTDGGAVAPGADADGQGPVAPWDEASGSSVAPGAEGHGPGTDGAAPADTAPGAEGHGAAAGASAPSGAGAIESFLHDGVTEGELIAEIPTERLVRSLLRDLGFLVGVVVSVVGVVVAIGLALWQEGVTFGVIIALAPTVFTVMKYVFGRIESGWGFVSRDTDRGLRMRRGLANTRTDNIASGRVQRIEMRRPLLWRSQGWTAVSATVAGIGETDQDGAQSVLPVGTREELAATLGHLVAPLGTEDDLAVLESLFRTRAREIPGMRTPARLFWIARRTEVTVLLPGALIHRSGILTRTVVVVPRERIQETMIGQGPLGRRLGVLDLSVRVAGESLDLSGLAQQDARALHGVLARDARTLRRYRDRALWPQPALGSMDPVEASRPRTPQEDR